MKPKVAGKKAESKSTKGSKAISKTQDGKKRRYKPGTVTLRTIKKLQKGTNQLLQKAPVQRSIRRIAKEFDPTCRMTPDALFAIQEATEAYIISVMEDCQMCAVHAKRVSVQRADMILARKIRGDIDFVARNPGSNELNVTL